MFLLQKPPVYLQAAFFVHDELLFWEIIWQFLRCRLTEIFEFFVTDR